MQKNCWHIKCNHTPEIIDRILMHFRKRGMAVDSLQYSKENDSLAFCKIEFTEEQEGARKLFNNLLRTVDIIDIQPVG